MPSPCLPQAATAPVNVLVAERSPTISRVIAAWLRGWGMHAEIARSPAEASAALATQRFDVVVADAALDIPEAAAPRRLTLVAPGEAAAGPTLARPVQADALRVAIDALLAGPPSAEAPAAPAGPDLAAIAELWGAADTPAFRRIASVFLAEAPSRLAGIVTAHAAADRDRVAHEAHALAGAALNVGLPEVVRLARAIEHAAPARPLADIAPDILALQEAAIRDFDALHRLAGPA